MFITIADVRSTLHHADTRLCLASRRDLEVALSHLAAAQVQLELLLVERASADTQQLPLLHAHPESA